MAGIVLALSGLIAARPVFAQDGGSGEIVYVDVAGFVRVYDYTFSANASRVQWYSPEGGYIDVALGDVNRDGDMEIIAIGGDTDASRNMGPPRLVVFDPVVADPDAPIDGRINNIPWARLYTRTLPANPKLVDGGELRASIPGDEIIYVTETPDDHPDPFDNTQLTILSNTTDPPTGRAWSDYVDRLTFNQEWSWLRLGDIDDFDLDEIILVDNDRGLLRLYRNILDDPIFERRNENNRWRAAVVGNFRNRSDQDLFAIRNSRLGLPSFWVFQYRNGDFRDDYAEWFEPAPEAIFVADVENSGGDEAFMLRGVPETSNQPRLFSRDEEGRTILQEPLDTDNGYLAGEGGNVDADPEDEVVIIRNNAIRIYLDPRAGSNSVTINTSTNGRSIRIGDLDAAGFSPGPTFLATPPTVNSELEQDASGGAVDVTLENATTSANIPFTAEVEGGASWVRVESNGVTTQAVLTVTFDATGLQPATYNAAIIIRSSNQQVANQPYRIPTTLTVLPGMTLTPNSVTFVYYPCDAPTDVRSQVVAVQGGTGDNFVAQADSATGPADWVTITPTNGPLPGELTVTVDPTRLATEEQLDGSIVVRTDGDPFSERTAPLRVVCAGHQIELPLVKVRD